MANPEINPYIFRSESRSTVTSNYHDVAMAMGQRLNREPYALKGARTVRGGEAQQRFLLHSPSLAALPMLPFP